MSVIIHTLGQLRAAIDSVDHHFVNVHFGPYAPVIAITREEAHRVFATLPPHTTTTDPLGLARLYDEFIVIGHS